jgi:glycosyltransferase involved in cell wall biosynthesis
MTRLRIGIDGFNLAMSRGTGVATYARVLSHAIAGLGHHVDVLYGLPLSARASPVMREVAFFDRLEQEERRGPKPVLSARWWREQRAGLVGCTAQEIPMTGLVDRRSFRMPAFDRVLNVSELFPMASRHFRSTRRFLRVRVENPPDIMHWTYPLPIVVEGARNIYTIHDLVPLRLPHTTLDNKGYYFRLIRGCVAAGAGICTVSQASRADIVRLFPQAAGKLTNTYESIDVSAAGVPAGQELADYLRGVFGLGIRGYFLFFGSLEPKKNIGRLLEAYLSAGVSTPLVVVGAQAWKSERELSLLKFRSQGGDGGPNIRQIDYLPFGTLLRLIRGARAVLFPSLYEGFGLPVAEAMALGTPVLTSTEGSLPEIAGDAAVMVDPYDVQAIARGIRRIDSDDVLRGELEARGPVQAARFGAGPYAGALAGLYQAIMKYEESVLF